jgi:phenylalanyl-tRNA synthetase beta chain
MLGILGQVHPLVLERFDLDRDRLVLAAELNFDVLLRARQPLVSVATPSRFPPADRDVSFFVAADARHAEIEKTIREAAGPLLEHARLFDVYAGASGSDGRKSLAYSLRYRAPDRTLEEQEVAAAHANVEAALRARFGAEVRGR